MPWWKPSSPPSKRRSSAPAAAPSAGGEELARAARILAVRSRREATGLFAGNYRSAFRGGGLEFEESRPYAPGDDVRAIDWNATARAGEPFVKRFREERDQTLLLALDVSESMSFGSQGRDKAATAAQAVALLAAAAGRAGDRTALVAFDDAVRARVPVSRGAGQVWRVIRAAAFAAAAGGGGTDLAVAARTLRAATRHRGVAILLSDFRDPSLLSGGRARIAAAALARRHDLVAAALVDPREQAVPPAGPVRIDDPEHPGRPLRLDTGSRAARERYRAACAVWRRSVEHELRGLGADVLWLRTDRDPLFALGRFFHERAGRVRVAA